VENSPGDANGRHVSGACAAQERVCAVRGNARWGAVGWTGWNDASLEAGMVYPGWATPASCRCKRSGPCPRSNHASSRPHRPATSYPACVGASGWSPAAAVRGVASPERGPGAAATAGLAAATTGLAAATTGLAAATAPFVAAASPFVAATGFTAAAAPFRGPQAPGFSRPPSSAFCPRRGGDAGRCSQKSSCASALGPHAAPADRCVP
jgi:hypothetical protein